MPINCERAGEVTAVIDYDSGVARVSRVIQTVASGRLYFPGGGTIDVRNVVVSEAASTDDPIDRPLPDR